MKAFDIYINNKIEKKSLFVFLIVFLIFTNSCKDKSKLTSNDNLLFQIKKRGKIIVTTNYNSIDYFIYKGLPMGFQLEMMNAFAKYLGVKTEFIITNDLASNAGLLAVGKCDLIANNITVSPDRKKIISFTIPIMQTRQVLVQRVSYKDKIHKKTELIRSKTRLSGKTVVVQKNSFQYDRLRQIEDEICNSINIVVNDTSESEQLIEMVANGTIDYTLSDENIAKVNKSYYENIDIQTSLSRPQDLAWGLRKESDSLLQELNLWISKFKKTTEFKSIYDKYYENPRSVKIVQSEFYSIKKGKISNYDKEIKKYSKKIRWDWRLLASLIYQESQFHPELQGWSGAFGIMQMMPQTAQKFGITINSSVSEQIHAGVKLKVIIDKILPKEIDNHEERIKFILASYNAGIYHVLDARRLAEKYGKNPNIWTNNVDRFMKLKSNPKYYNDPVVKYGYSRGFETFKFVNEVLERYHHYKNIVK